MLKDPNQDGDFNSFMDDWNSINVSFQDRLSKHLYYYYQLALDEIERLKCDSVLDFGCADGVLIGKIQESNKPPSLSGVEISHKGRVNCLKNTGIEPSPSLDDQMASKFDAVVALEVMEHISNPLDTLKDLYELANKVLIFTVPIENKIKSKFHVNIFNYYQLYEMCEKIAPKFKMHFLNKFKKDGNPLNMFGVYLYK